MKSFKEFLTEAKDAYVKGFEAGTKAYKDKVTTANPFPKGSKDHKDWKEGFNDAYDQGSK